MCACVFCLRTDVSSALQGLLFLLLLFCPVILQAGQDNPSYITTSCGVVFDNMKPTILWNTVLKYKKAFKKKVTQICGLTTKKETKNKNKGNKLVWFHPQTLTSQLCISALTVLIYVTVFRVQTSLHPIILV